MWAVWWELCLPVSCLPSCLHRSQLSFPLERSTNLDQRVENSFALVILEQLPLRCDAVGWDIHCQFPSAVREGERKEFLSWQHATLKSVQKNCMVSENHRSVQGKRQKAE